MDVTLRSADGTTERSYITQPNGYVRVHVRNPQGGFSVAEYTVVQARSEIKAFLAEQGYVEVDEAAEQQAYDEGYKASGLDDGFDVYYDEIDEHPEAYTEQDRAWAVEVKAHLARIEADKNYARGVKDAARDEASHAHEQAWLQGQRYQ